MAEERPGVAIVGMACAFPGAPDLETFRANLEQGVDAITEVPPGRWDPVFFDPDSTALDRIYCRRGGFLGSSLPFDPLAYGIMPVAAKAAEPDQMLTLDLVGRALRDAALDPDGDRLPRERTGVILGRGGYPGARMVNAIHHMRTAQQLVEALKPFVPALSDDQVESVRQAFIAQLDHYGPESVIGMVPNIVASRVSNRFDLQGTAYTVDAACASSLLAVDQSVRALLTHEADLMITGGVHLCDDLFFFNTFARLGAMSRSQRIRPFDRRADGLLIGEGIGILVLKRLADAERAADRIYAVIRGCGVSSDGRGRDLLLPSVEGQTIAMRRAWRESGMDPTRIGLLEAHGTATPNGDRAELTTIARFFGGQPRHDPGLGSVKSMIGHTMPAAGAAGLIKTALAMYHRFLPPTLGCEEPHELVAKTGFRLIREAEPWEPDQRPLIAGVNAFGFGGINAHVVLDAREEHSRRHRGRRTGSETADYRLVAGDSPEALLTALDEGHSGRADGRYRLVIESPTAERRDLARKIVRQGKRWSGLKGIWYAPEGLAADGGGILFLYPGVDGRFNPRISDVATHFGRSLPAFSEARENLIEVTAGIIGLGLWLTDLLRELGIQPKAVAGHSIGEWTAMLVAGITPESEADQFIQGIVPSLRLEVPGVVFAAAGCGIERALQAIVGLEQITISHDNCPHQIILCGVEDSIDQAVSRLQGMGILAEKLSFRSGFHSRLFERYVAPLRGVFEHLTVQSPSLPIWSATTTLPYPAEPDQIRTLFIDHLVQPVRFRELTQQLYAEGFRAFIQVGVGRLAGFVSDTLKGLPHLAISANVEQRPGLQQLRRVAAELWCEGYPVQLEPLGLRLEPAPSTLVTAGRSLQLPLAVPLVRFSQPLAWSRSGWPPAAVTPGPSASPLMAELAAMQADMLAAAAEVVEAWQDRRSAGPSLVVEAATPTESPQPRRVTRRQHYSLETMPELIDHCLIKQPRDWPTAADRFPTVPLTRSLDLLIRFAEELLPGRVVVGLERVRATRWIEVAPPQEIEIVAEIIDDERIEASIGDHLACVILMALAYPTAKPPTPLEVGPLTVPWVDAQEIYAQRWVFHGPQYQAVEDLTELGTDGIRGVIKSLPAPGALLDAATQVAAMWCMLHVTDNRPVLPYRADAIRFYRPHPPAGTRWRCDVRPLELTDERYRCDILIYDEESLWVRIVGWEDRRFEINDRLFAVSKFPEHHLSAEIRPDGFAILEQSWRTTATRYLIARRYLDSAEFGQYQALSANLQPQWLLGRMVLKDAVRAHLRKGDGDLLFPIQIHVENESTGRPTVRGPWPGELRVSVAHKPGIAVAIVAEGQDVGIDVERIEPRSPDLMRSAFMPAELDLLPLEAREVWLTRLWVAKEAVAKARGRGILSDVLKLQLEALDGTCLCLDGTWVETRQEGVFIVGWTRDAGVGRSITLSTPA